MEKCVSETFKHRKLKRVQIKCRRHPWIMKVLSDNCAFQVDDDDGPFDAIFIEDGDGVEELHARGITIFDISRRVPPKFEINDMVSVVFDVETVNINIIKKKIPDQVVTLSANTCIANRLIDRFYLTIEDPIIRDGEEFKELKRECRQYNEFSALYKNLITRQYLRLSDSCVINIIYCPKGEFELVEMFVTLLNIIRPHNTVTFHGEHFDYPVVIRTGFRKKYDVLANLSTLLPGDHAVMGTAPYVSLYKLKKTDSGFINKDTLDLQHDSMHPFLHTDLFKYNKGSLNDVCMAKLGAKKDDVSYAEIPDLLYSRDAKLMKYNIQDTDLTTELFFKDYFLSIRYFTTLQKITGTSWMAAASLKRSVPAVHSNYVTNMRNGFVQPTLFKPNRLHCVEVFTELIDYFAVYKQRKPISQLKYADCRQLLSEYHNGGLLFRSNSSKIKKVCPFTPATTTLSQSIRDHVVLGKKKRYCIGTDYTTLDLLVLLMKMTLSSEGFECKSTGLFKEYCKMFTFGIKHKTANQIAEFKQIRDKEEGKLTEFVFLCSVNIQGFISLSKCGRIVGIV